MVRLCIAGTGHVGLVYAVAFALDGHRMGAEVHVRRVQLDMEDRAVLGLLPMTG